jgi:hypothetical protein
MMQAHIAVSLGYTTALHLWMFLYFLVQGERIDELVTSSEERIEQGTHQAISWIEMSSLQCLIWA